MKRTLFLVALLALLVGCSDSNDNANNSADAGNADAEPDVVEPSEVTVSYDFESDTQGWQAEVTDYPTGAEGTINFLAEVRDLPQELETDGKGLYLEGHNEVRDIFMFIKRQLGPAEGLLPETAYRLQYTVTFASNYPDDCSEEVGQRMFWKMGGSKWEPSSRPNSDQTHNELNVKKGDNEVGGDAASTAGDLTHNEECAIIYDRYSSMTRQHSHSTNIETTADGNLWLLVGVDSEYEGETSFYIDSIEVTLHPQE